MPLLPSISDYQSAIYTPENITSFSDKIVFRRFSFQNDSEREDLHYNIQVFPTAYLALTFLSVICLCIFFASVEYIKIKRPNLKRQYQRNIVTFNQNFFFCLCFFIISMSLTLAKLIVPHLTSSENMKSILMFLYSLRLIFVCFLRPIIIILLLRKRMPHFFENYEKKKNIISIFYVSGNTMCPRNELFMPLKSFGQNARFGSEKKFEELNLRADNVIRVQRKEESDVTRKSKLVIGRRKMKNNCIPDVNVH